VTEVLVLLNDNVRLLIRKAAEIKITLASDTRHTSLLIRFVPNPAGIGSSTVVSLESLM
jgi:hypothetical protein